MGRAKKKSRRENGGLLVNVNERFLYLFKNARLLRLLHEVGENAIFSIVVVARISF